MYVKAFVVRVALFNELVGKKRSSVVPLHIESFSTKNIGYVTVIYTYKQDKSPTP